MICLLVEDDKKFEPINNMGYISNENLPIYYIMHLFFIINLIINIITSYTHNVFTIFNEIQNFIEDHLSENDPNIFNGCF